jgi:hypothetical protein
LSEVSFPTFDPDVGTQDFYTKNKAAPLNADVYLVWASPYGKKSKGGKGPRELVEVQQYSWEHVPVPNKPKRATDEGGDGDEDDGE